MAIQKHNTYYDPKKPNEGITYYDENGNHKEVLTRNDLNAISSISSINDKVTALSAKTVTQIKSTDTVTATPHTATDGTIYYELEAAPEVSDTVIYGINGISSTHEGTVWTIGLSSDFLSANALNSLSGNWQDTYNSVKSNSSNWNEVSSKVNSADFIPVKNDVEALKENSAHYPVESSNDFISVNSADHKFTLTFNSGNLATEPWVEEQLKNFGGFTTANADVSGYPIVVNPSTKIIYLVKNSAVTGKDQYSEWIYGTDSEWICIGDTSIDLSPLYELSANFNLHNEDEIRHITSLERTNWNEVSSKLDKSAFNSWSAQTENWDITEYSGGFGIDVSNHTITLTENYLSANALDNLSGKWEAASDALNASADYWNTIDQKLDQTAFETYTATADVTPYSGKNGIAVENHEIWVSADYLSASNQYLSANALENLSGRWESSYSAYSNSSNYWNETYNNVTNSSIIWNSATTIVNNSAEYWNRTYSSFIVFSAETNVDLTEVEEQLKDLYENVMITKGLEYDENGKISAYMGSAFLGQEYFPGEGIDITNNIISVSGKYAQSGWVEDNFQKKGDYLSANSLNNLSGNWESTYKTVSTNSATWEKVKDLHNVELSSTDNSIGISATTAEDGTVNYNLSVDEVAIPDIIGENGVSARFDEEKGYVVGLEEQTYCYGEAQTNTTTIASLNEVIGNFVNVSTVGNKIGITSNTITLEKGLYHIDIQINVNINSVIGSYYDVELVNNLSNGALSKVIDGSYLHTETLDLSFDVKLLNNSNTLTLTLKGLPAGNEYYVKNLQIHEIVTIDGVLEATGGSLTLPVNVGTGNNVSQTSAIGAIGNNCSAGTKSFAFSYKGATASNNSFAVNDDNVADNNSFAWGWANTADNYSIAGGNATSADEHSFALGNAVYTKYWTLGVGRGLEFSGDSNSNTGIGALVAGGWNKTTSNAIFVLGNGTGNDSYRRDAVVVDRSGNTKIYGSLTVDVSSGNNVLAVASAATLFGASRQTSAHYGVDNTAIGTTWVGVGGNGMHQGFIKYTDGGDVGALDTTSTIQINIKPENAGYNGEMTLTNVNGSTTAQSKVVNVPTASYSNMSSFDNTNGPNYMLRKTASGFDIGAAVINVTSLPSTTEANAYYFVYDV